MKKISLLLLVVIGLSPCGKSVSQLNDEARYEAEKTLQMSETQMRLDIAKVQLDEAKRKAND